MTHLDLFSGIGGFAYAADQVFGDVEHIFCEIDTFCQQVLNKHWPEAKIYDDIKQIDSDTYGKGLQGQKPQRSHGWPSTGKCLDLLTGGFPCQPFSAAGLRRGTADDRHLWPEMLRVIRLTRPTWVIAENVRGIVSWNDGLVFEQVCTDLEAAGYEVQPFVIPAVAVNAPHRRDRVWFIANRTSDRRSGRRPQAETEKGHAARPESGRQLPGGSQGQDSDAANADIKYATSRGKREDGIGSQTRQASAFDRGQGKYIGLQQEWSRDWHEVAAELCSVDDGFPVELGEFKLTKAGHRKEQLKAYGNAIVPQVAIEIMRSLPI